MPLKNEGKSVVTYEYKKLLVHDAAIKIGKK